MNIWVCKILLKGAAQILGVGKKAGKLKGHMAIVPDIRPQEKGSSITYNLSWTKCSWFIGSLYSWSARLGSDRFV
jgi:hypothetical protein